MAEALAYGFTRCGKGSAATRAGPPPDRADREVQHSATVGSPTVVHPAFTQRSGLLEAGRIAGADAEDLRLVRRQVDHGGGLDAALPVDDGVQLVVEEVLDLPALGHRLVLPGQQQR